MTGKEKQSNTLLDYSPVSLRAFHEAAKHESFTMAAARMSVTQSAVSHHIKTLEAQMQVRLFERRGRALRLTSEGRVLYKGMEQAYGYLTQSIEHISSGAARARVVVGVLSSFAAKWLVPRLGGFYRKHPNVELVVRSVNHTIDVEREQVDVAVVNLPAPPASHAVKSELLWRERLFAVCSPRYAKRHAPLNRPRDLERLTLLHDETEIAAERGLDWASWLRHFKVDIPIFEFSSQYFSQSDLTLQAAIAEHGVALARASIAGADIKSGLLTNPFAGADMRAQTACYLCGLTENWRKPAIAGFTEWLIAEAQADPARDEGSGK